MNDRRRALASFGMAAAIREWLDERIAEIQQGDIAEARSGLERAGWWDRLEFVQVPLYPLTRIADLVNQAADQLADRALDPERARSTLQAARELVTAPEAS